MSDQEVMSTAMDSRLHQYWGFLKKETDCVCGRRHETGVREIDAEPGALKRLPGLLRKMGFKKAFLVADLRTLNAVGQAICSELLAAGFPFENYILQEETPVADEKTVGSLFFHFPGDADLVLAVGSGTVVDMCKYLSFSRQVECAAVLSAPSTDSFIPACSELIVNGEKKAFTTQTPVAVIADIDILAQAPMDLISAGLGVITGKAVDLLDWKLSHIITGEYCCPEILDMMRASLQMIQGRGELLRDRNPDAVRALTQALILSGLATASVDSSRPASGCEYFISRHWENRFMQHGKVPFLPGAATGLAAVAALAMCRMLAEAPVKNPAAAFRPAADSGQAAVRDLLPEILSAIREDFPSVEAAETLLLSLDAPVNPEQIGLSLKDVKESILSEDFRDTRDLEDCQEGGQKGSLEGRQKSSQKGSQKRQSGRNCYSLLSLLRDLGILETCADRLCQYFSPGDSASSTDLSADEKAISPASHQDTYSDEKPESHQDTYFKWKKETMRSRIQKVKCFVLDMDGTIYLSKRLFPFTKPFLDRLSETGRHFCYFTNNSSSNQQNYIDKLSGMGIPADPGQIFLSTQVILEEMQRLHPDELFYIVGTPNLSEAFRRAGLKVCEDQAVSSGDRDRFYAELLRQDEGAPHEQGLPVVILGFDMTLDYEKISLACRFLMRGAPYYGVNMDYNCPVDNNGYIDYIPDCGSIARLVERSTGRFPDFYGKPSRHALDYVIRHTGFAEEEIAVVGDRIYTDIAIANKTRALSIMVLTGETQMEDLVQYDFRPDFILPSLAEITELL